MSVITSPFDIASHLKTDEDIQAFLQEVNDTGDTSDFIHALNIAARAKGMSQVAKKVGVTRASLYKSLSPEGNPGFDTIRKVVTALGGKLAIV
jgi:probable addiction module antidote protein